MTLGNSLIEELEHKLDSFDIKERQQALGKLCEIVRSGGMALPNAGTNVNLHYHTFFSYNSCGYSPSKIAWLARKNGLQMAGIVDFDVLDGLDEFLRSAGLLNLKACGGLETRVFVPEFSTEVINSPGEPGIAYHIGIGFTKADLPAKQDKFLNHLRKTARQRNEELVHRVNEYLRPVVLDYQKDVLVLTPKGNATERHVCLAYARKAKEIFDDEHKLTGFWSEKLRTDVSSLHLPEGQDLLNTIRAKLIKKGGAGYVQPDAGAFPRMKDTNEFFLESGAIPTLAWLDGTSQVEKRAGELLEAAMNIGVAAVNVIPDRNYTPGVKDERLKNLYSFVDLAESLQLPVIVGTEMNSPGQKFVDEFKSGELSPLVPIFLKGGHIVYAHTVLQKQAGLGYLSEWAKDSFKNTAEKNAFYQKFGSTFTPQREHILAGINENTTPEAILDLLGK